MVIRQKEKEQIRNLENLQDNKKLIEEINIIE